MAQVPFIRTPALAWVLGALTLWPHVYVVGFVVTLALRVVTGGLGGASDGAGPPSWFVALFLTHLATMLIVLVLLAAYLVDVFQNQELQGTDKRLVWILLVVLVGPLAEIVYWWLHLRPTGPAFRRRRAWLLSLRAIDGA